ncbi:hypothetical protein ACFPH6_49335 [Streptomyces xiangluensis]|uniref:Uncharacterized protein n=1 Tax=Streptomyces xiangluensis TaxID=2665720 RepID=A0ABV8Z4K4_9ACTN
MRRSDMWLIDSIAQAASKDLDAILYVNRAGIAWRYLLLDYPQRMPPR